MLHVSSLWKIFKIQSFKRYDHVLSLKQLLNLFKYLQSQDKQAAYYPCHYKWSTYSVFQINISQ